MVRKMLEGEQVQPNFAQFVSVFTLEVVKVFDYFDVFSGDARMLTQQGYLPGLQCY
jgi:hypothetical protein